MGLEQQQGSDKQKGVFKAGEKGEWMTDPETGEVMSTEEWEKRKKTRLEDDPTWRLEQN